MAKNGTVAMPIMPTDRSLSAANFNKLGLKRLICTSYNEGRRGSPLAGSGGQTTLFDEYNSGENACNDRRRKPKTIAVIVDHVRVENNNGATDIEDVKLFRTKNMAISIALKGKKQYPSGDFRYQQVSVYDTW